MLSKNKIKFINLLKKKKHRQQKGLFIAEGTKVVTELLGSGARAQMLFATPGWYQKQGTSHLANIIEREEITEKDLQKISNLKTSQEVLGVFEIPQWKVTGKDLPGELSLVLDRINDPGNLGTIVRIADWFGIRNIICSPDTVDLYNPKTVQSTMGSIGRVRVVYEDLPAFLSGFSGMADFPVYGCYLEGDNLYTTPLDRQGLIVMGSESHGISESLKNYIQHPVYIPSFSPDQSSGAESLNVSIAAGIVCSEFRRRASVFPNHSK